MASSEPGMGGAPRRYARLLTVALTVFAVGLVPYAYAWATCPPDRYFTGLMFNVPDHAQYWSWVTASRAGLFIANTMTPEPNAPIFMNPMMWVLARVQAMTGWSFGALFQFWRLLAAVCVVFGLAFAVRTLVADRAQRRTAFWLVLLGSGFGFAWVAVKYLRHLPEAPFPHDIYTSEPNTFWGLLAYPYLPFSQALIFTAMASAWRAHLTGAWRYVAIAAASALALALFHAYDLIPVYAALGLSGLALWARHRQFPRNLAVAGTAIAVASGPVAFYYQRLTATDPLWQRVLAQYVNAGAWTPPHLHLVVLIGLPLLLVVVALVTRCIDRDERLFAAIWALSGLVLMYVPVVYQIKFLNGWQLPIAVLAVAAWHERVAPRLVGAAAVSQDRRAGPEWRRASLAGALLVALTLPTNLYFLAWRMTEMRKHEAPYFMHADEKAALDWLAANSTPQDVALAPLALGQFVPNYGRTRAFVAHWAMTVDFFARRDAADRFFEADTPAQWRADLLAQQGITLVLRPAAASWTPGPGAPFVRVFEQPAAAVYRVTGGAAVPAGGAQ